MSNYLAIATVTATLQRILQVAVQADVAGATVTTARPDATGGNTPEVGVNIFLYQAAPNPAWRNADLRTRRPRGDLIKQAQAGIDLSYLMTFYGNELELQPQQLMGTTIRTLIDQPILTPEMIQETVNTFSFLEGSTLAEQIERVTLVPAMLSTDDLSKIWSVFFQTPYMLSFAYQGTTVLIEGEKAGKPALPIRSQQFYVAPNQPTIEQVVPETGVNQPIASTSALTIRGRQLNMDQPHARIGEARVTLQSVKEREIQLNLASLSVQQRSVLRAGVQSLQLVSLMPKRRASDPDQFVGSNIVPFILCPTIAAAVETVDLSHNDGLYSAELVVQLDLNVGVGQRLFLLLNQRSSSTPAAYIFAAKPREMETDRVRFPILDVRAGEYLIRVQVDGAESLLTVDTQPGETFEQYIAPSVVIS